MKPKFRKGNWVIFDVENNTKEQLEYLFSDKNLNYKDHIHKVFQIKTVKKKVGLVILYTDVFNIKNSVWCPTWFKKVPKDVKKETLEILYGKK